MRFISKCGFCENCVILASMAGAAAVPLKTDSAVGVADVKTPSELCTVSIDQAENSPNLSAQEKNVDTDQKQKFDQNEAKSTSMESWCVVWYLGAFGSLVSFFLVITCVELFFRNPLYHRSNILVHPYLQDIVNGENRPYVPETPPPPYHLFAPPDYNETIQKIVTEKRASLDVFVVPVHGKSAFAPPAYDQMERKKFKVVAVQGKSNPSE